MIMPKPLQDYDLCYQCGWLGMCTVACPLLDPARMIPPGISTQPTLDDALDDVAFEITTPEDTDDGPGSN